jgi:hypothetical protein
MTLDVIGLAGMSTSFECPASTNAHSGFNYRFDALTNDPKENELHKAFSIIFRSGMSLSLIPILRGMVPAFRFLVCLNEVLASPNSSFSPHLASKG